MNTIPASCVHVSGYEHPSDGSLPCQYDPTGAEMVALHGKRICIDLDGVLHSYTSGWVNERTVADPPEPGAAEFLHWLLDAGAEPILFTTRGNSEIGVRAVMRWLADFRLPPLPVTATKPPYAVAFIDDRAIRYVPGSGDWHSVQHRLVHLLAEGPRVRDPWDDQPWLGLATTDQLLAELQARCMLSDRDNGNVSRLMSIRRNLRDHELAYRTVGE